MVMAILRVLSILFGVLAVMMLGAASGPVEAESMPCHEQAMQMTPSSDTPELSKAVGSPMACCVMCVVSPLQGPVTPLMSIAISTPTSGVSHGTTGLVLSPEAPPPRRPASL